jgi:hypothetical protein
MNRVVIDQEHVADAKFSIVCPVLWLLILLTWSGAPSFAQNISSSTGSTNSLNIRASHLLGFEGTPNNAGGTLSIQDNEVLFQQKGRPAAQVKISSVQNVFLGEQSKQVGGAPMAIGKAAVPFGGGRVISLFSHKKYDTLTLEYIDSDGGIHGAIFQLNKGQAEAFKNGLVARGVRSGNEPSKQSATEVSNGKI